VNETSDVRQTRFEIGEEIARIFGKTDAASLFSKTSRAKIFKAPRPDSSAIANTKLPKFPHWRDFPSVVLKRKITNYELAVKLNEYLTPSGNEFFW